MLSRLLVRSAHIWRAPAILLLAVSLLGGTIHDRAAAQTTATAASTAYGNLPLSFELNQGQADPAVDFVAHGPGFSLALSAGDALLSLGQAEPSPSVLRVQLQGAEPHPRAVGQERLGGTANYFLGTDPSQWHTGIPTYARVQYQDVYPGIDLDYYGTRQGQLEDDFVVAPGADPSSIQMGFPQGANGVTLDTSGALVLDTSAGPVQLPPPGVYQDVAGVRVPIPAAYVLHDQQVGVAVGSYDTSRPLVIDPVLVYSTLLGGTGQENGAAIAVDASGSAYVTGRTFSTDFPTTAGALQRTAPGFLNAFVNKLNPDGTGLVYSTYLGGANTNTLGFGITVDSIGDAYVTGIANGSNFPTTPGAFQRTNLGNGDAFISKLNPSGSALVFSTLLGGSSIDLGTSVAVDSVGNVYVTGNTGSTSVSPGTNDFPITQGAFQRTSPGGQDAFVSKLNPTGTALVYSTYLGGNNSGSGIAVDAAGDAYMTGTTASADFPTTPGAFQTVFPGAGSVTLSKLNPSGSGLVYSTFLGAGIGNAVVVDAAGNAFVAGTARSSEFPTTPGAFQRTFRADEDAFVSKLNPTGSTLVFSTLLGGNASNGGASLAVDTAGNVYVTGFTAARDFPITPGAFQPAMPGYTSAFVSKLDPTGSSLVYSSFLGGSLDDTSSGIAVDRAGNAYVIGDAGSSNFPTTPGAFQRTFGGISDAFVVRIAPGPPGCVIKALLPGPPAQLQVLLHADRGLSSVVVTQATNTSVSLPTFTPGTTGTFLVTATKLDQSLLATFTLRATDQTGASTSCDPALVSVGRAPGDSPVQVIHHVARTESHVTITNGTPGVSSLRLLVNGHSFEATDLQNGESRTLDVSSAMRQGSDNTILAIAHGPRDSRAAVLVSDS